MDKIAPTRSTGNIGRDETEVINHPAFGCIGLSRVSCRGERLFGSEMQHNSLLRITINTASNSRHLNKDWISADKRMVEFEMTESQWARFISSAGQGAETPITFTMKPVYESLERVPGIAVEESLKDVFSREILEDCKKAVADAHEALQIAKELRDAGKAGKGQLSDLVNRIERVTHRLPESLNFAHKQFEHSMEKIVESSKTEVESFANQVIMRTGLDALQGHMPRLAPMDDQPAIEQD